MTRYYTAAPARTRLQAVACARGLPLVVIADDLGIPRRTMWRILNGARIRWDTADRVAVALGHHPCELWPDWFPATPQRTKGITA